MGEHQTPKRPYVNWNAELIWKMRTELAFQWDILEEEIPRVFEQLLRPVRDRLANLKSLIRGEPRMLRENPEDCANRHRYDQRKDWLSHWSRESTPESGISSTDLALHGRILHAR
jgi:hypothetical protein